MGEPLIEAMMMTPSKYIHPYGTDYPKCVFSARSSAYGMSYPTNYSTYRMLFFSLCVSLKGGNRKNDWLKLFKSFRCYKRLSSVYSHSKKDKLSVSMSSVGLSAYLCTPTSPHWYSCCIDSNANGVKDADISLNAP